MGSLGISDPNSHQRNEHDLNPPTLVNGVHRNRVFTEPHYDMAEALGSHEGSEKVAEPIAIVGMGMRLPGGIQDSEGLWDLLINKRSARCEVPADRYNVEAFHGPANKPGHVATKHGYFLQNIDLANLDSSFWSMTKQEAESMDPQQRLLLEVVYEALENGGAKGWRGRSIGCYVGVFGEDWLDMDLKDDQNAHMYRMLGYSDYALSNRVSYEFGFTGPSITVRTACSSSLNGLHEACAALGRGECEAAVVGGTNIITAPRMTIALTQQGVISPTGSCKTFDASADGYARGEGVTALYLKRLSHAVRDGDPIRAVIRSTAVNSDGKTSGMTLPSSLGHEAVIRKAYKSAGIVDFSKTAMVECHGTGTRVGDPIETKAVGKVFGTDGIYIGSVKPNLGHSEGNAGLSSVLKMVLALERKTIPPNINFHTPNPDIPFKTANLSVPVNPMAWPHGKSQRVGVNSFGLGGANAHVILESLDCFRSPSANGVGGGGHEANTHKYTATQNGHKANSAPSYLGSSARLLVFSAKHPEALDKLVRKHEAYALDYPNKLRDISYTLCCRREHHPYRTFSVANSHESFEQSATSVASDAMPNLVYVFTGQGAQWAEMGKQLFETSTTFRRSIDNLDHHLATSTSPPSWTLANEIMLPKARSRLSEAEYSQPCCTAIQVGIVDVLMAAKVSPSAVIGHSSGEIAAAYACGAITAKDAILVAYHRGQATKNVGKFHFGGMAAVGLGRRDLSPYLQPGVTIGCENSPGSVTITGDTDVLEEVMYSIRNDHPDTLVRSLRVQCAYHSYHMNAIASGYKSSLSSLKSSQKPRVPLFSSVTGKIIKDEDCLAADYWIQNLVSPVLFYSAAKLALDTFSPSTTFLEIGPHSALAGPIRQIIRSHSSAPTADYIPTLVRNADAYINILQMAGSLWLRNVDIDLSRIVQSGKFLIDLPAYPWHYEGKYWAESRLSKEWRLRKYGHHDLLGTRVISSTSKDPSWRNLLRLGNVSWLRDHVIQGNILFPAAGFVAMAGEAIRQLAGGTLSSFIVRRVSIHAALMLQSSETIETITTLRRLRLTTSLESKWYEFTVSSLRGEEWITHVAGQVSPAEENPRVEGEGSSSKPQPLPRQIHSSSWYKAMSRVGLLYGQRFRLLEDISAHPTECRAIAKLPTSITSEESDYLLHPTTLDAAFQLLYTAASKGLPKLLVRLAVPTYIEELTIGQHSCDIVLNANSITSPSNVLLGDLTGVGEGKHVIELKGLRMQPIDDNIADRSDNTLVRSGVGSSHAAVELQWDRDINFIEPGTLLRPDRDISDEHKLLEEFALACIIETGVGLQQTVRRSSEPHLDKFASWILQQQQKASSRNYPNVAMCQKLATMSHSERCGTIERLQRQLAATGAAAPASAIYRQYLHLDNIWSGAVQPMDVLAQEDAWIQINDYIQLCGFGEYVRLLTHSEPNLRILDIGAGRDGHGSSIVSRLVSRDSGDRMFASYVYTDVFEQPLANVQRLCRNIPAMDFAVFDIGKSLSEQSLKPESFDLIIARNAIHHTGSLHQALANVKRLLRPRGRLLMQELSPTTKWMNYVMGALPGWWHGEADNRLDEPYVTAERWEHELKTAGFDVEAMVHDGQLNNNIIARLPNIDQAKGISKTITVLTGTPTESLVPAARAVVDQLLQRGFQIDFCNVRDKPVAGQLILSLLDFEGQFLNYIDSENFHALKELLLGHHVDQGGILWVTNASQVRCQDPRYAAILGLARTLRSELLMDFATLELDSFEAAKVQASAVAVVDVLQHFQQRVRKPDMAPTLEYVWDDGNVLTGKFHWISIPKALQREEDHSLPKILDFNQPGSLQSLYWRETLEPPNTLIGSSDDNIVELEVKAAGLNFKDVLIAMGIIENTTRTLGLECAGIVTSMGPGVKDLTVGDRVMSMTQGSFATVVRTSENLCVKMPDDVDFSAGATMPCAFGTVIHSLVDTARLQKGQTILIHSACGAVGMAAVQVAQMIGAEVYCTVGNQDKVRHMIEFFGIPRNRIFNSRDDSFLEGVRAATKNAGVDVVLNSLSGELLHASWKCVAKFGTMIEIGKRDFIGQGLLSMDLFEQNRSFVGVDFSEICKHRPLMVKSILQRMVQYLKSGLIKPITPMTEFEASNIQNAFRHMQKGQHIGKIAVTFPSRNEKGGKNALDATLQSRELRLRPDRAYLIVGGLGGIGRSVAQWLVEQGARHIVFFSRSAGSLARDDPYILELEAQGCKCTAISGDVGDSSAVVRAVKSPKKPIGGVIQASMVLNDEAFDKMTFAQWQATTRPKVSGTWNLHKVLLRQKEALDFFFLFSSVSGIAGQPGQANYASANVFLDAFVQYRHSLGLPASVLDVGPMDDVGYLSRNTKGLDTFRTTGLQILREQELLDALHLMLLRSFPEPSDAGDGAIPFVNKSQLGIGMSSSIPLGAKNNRVLWRSDPRMAIYRNLEASNLKAEGEASAASPSPSLDTVTGQLASLLVKARRDPSLLSQEEAVLILAKTAANAIAGPLNLPAGQDIDLSVPLASLGLDSLVGIEVRNWLRLSLGVELTVVEFGRSGNLLGLGANMANKLKESLA